MMTNEDHLYKLYQAAIRPIPVPQSMLQPNDYMVNHLIATFNIATLLNQPKTIDRIVKPNERFEFRMKCDKCEKYIKFQRKRMEYISNILSNTLLPLPIIARGLTYRCPYCHHMLPYPKSVLGISDHKYVPTLSEGALEIGRKDWEANGDHPLTEDDFYWIAAVALNEAYPDCWFPYTNKYLRGLKIEYIRVGEMRININDYHRLFTRRGLTKPYRGGII